jgi:hypothetical protein
MGQACNFMDPALVSALNDLVKMGPQGPAAIETEEEWEASR